EEHKIVPVGLPLCFFASNQIWEREECEGSTSVGTLLAPGKELPERCEQVVVAPEFEPFLAPTRQCAASETAKVVRAPAGSLDERFAREDGRLSEFERQLVPAVGRQVQVEINRIAVQTKKPDGMPAHN